MPCHGYQACIQFYSFHPKQPSLQLGRLPLPHIFLLITFSSRSLGITPPLSASTPTLMPGTPFVEGEHLLHTNQVCPWNLSKLWVTGVPIPFSSTSPCHYPSDFSQLTCFPNPFCHTLTNVHISLHSSLPWVWAFKYLSIFNLDMLELLFLLCRVVYSVYYQ